MARQLTLAEFDIANIQASTGNDQQLAASEVCHINTFWSTKSQLTYQKKTNDPIQMLDLFRRKRSNQNILTELVAALRAIKRFSLAARVSELANPLLPSQ